MVERHHRCVFSTTIHGYEGCGRGFTLKFQQWLKQQRAGTAFYHLEQPIRWSKDDPLENWLFDTFLLNAELTPTETVLSSDVKLSKIDKTQLISNPELLRTCFALLVNAHYQTSPNDLMLLLEDEAIQLFAAFNHGDCLGCMLTVCEGELEPTLIESIQQGNRRPKAPSASDAGKPNRSGGGCSPSQFTNHANCYSSGLSAARDRLIYGRAAVSR